MHEFHADVVTPGGQVACFAGYDPYVEDHVIPDLQAALDEHGLTYTLEVHPGTAHGFCFPERPSYVEAAAEKVWQKVFGLYGRTLQAQP